MLEAARGSSAGPLVFVSTSFYSPQAGTKQIDLFRAWIRRAILVHGPPEHFSPHVFPFSCFHPHLGAQGKGRFRVILTRCMKTNSLSDIWSS